MLTTGNTSIARKKGALAAAVIALASLTAQPAAIAERYDIDASLLPPEVVPLDPEAASALAQSQAESRQVSLAAQDAQVPGLVDGGSTGMQTAQQFRNSAFEALYNQGQPPEQQQVWRAGLQYRQQPQQQPFAPPGYPMQQQYPMAPGLVPPQQAPPPVAYQSQMLTGGLKSQPQARDVRRGGFTHALSALAGFGAGAATSSALIAPSNPYVGLGIFGLTMTGFGVRNAFRF